MILMEPNRHRIYLGLGEGTGESLYECQGQIYIHVVGEDYMYPAADYGNYTQHFICEAEDDFEQESSQFERQYPLFHEKSNRFNDIMKRNFNLKNRKTGKRQRECKFLRMRQEANIQND